MMRPIRFSLLLTGVCAVLPVTCLFAQAPATPEATPSVSVPAAGTEPSTGTDPSAGRHEKGAGHMKAAMAALTPEERQQFHAARQKAMADPAVQEAKANRANDKKGFHQAMHAAMLKADPNIQPVLDKMRNAAGGKHMKRKDLQTS